ncbi:MAG: three-Cys-motif partner protein TcmP [Actinomycetota bacterium]|nr:three-Cys-motif partner protein TcmP [Actinomycetota bacterium]
MSRKQELREKAVWRSDPHTLVKHLVYRHYLDCWMPKILQKFPTATIVDAFAGPGVYEDGPVGSPLLIAKTFLGHSAYARFNNLRVVCLEQRADRVARLRAEIAAVGQTPKLQMTVLEPSEFAAQQPFLSQVAHGDRPNSTPVLWLLDPFNIKSLPFYRVADCLSGRYDEAVVTFFTEEMHRFCTREGFDLTLDEHFGSADWRGAAQVYGEAQRKDALVNAYRRSLRRAKAF